MFWKKWPYWLRGGAIAGGISILFIFTTFWCMYKSIGYGALGCLTYLLPVAYPPGWILEFIGSIFHRDPGLFAEKYLVYSIVPVWFLLGSLIGALVGYLKSRKRKVE